MLQIPVKLDLEAGKAEQALRDFFNGVEDALDGILDLNGSKVDFEVNMRTTGDDVVKELKDTEAATKKLTDSVKKHNKGQDQSISRTKFKIQQLKKERDELTANTQKHKEAAQAVKKLEAEFRTLQGVQSGSINDLKSQRNELVSLKNSVKINTPEFKKLTKEIKNFDKQLAATGPKANSFVGAFAKVAIVSAGIQAVGSALRSVGNTVDTYVRRTKEVEGFNLALRNVGIEQAEVSRIFEQANTTASALGAPLAQVEKTYKRMIPALQAVGTSSKDSDNFIEQISARTQTLGLNTEQSGRLLEAFAQVLSKGKLQAEELNQQISELDGAFRTQFADALGVSSAALNDLISSSQITADVFVETVNKMSNGAEALKQRIIDGTATIQQFENEISRIDTKNIESIGKAIEPAIKSFLRIRLAVAEFIKEFSKSAQFDTLVTIFNSTAKGAELFAAGLIKVLQVIGELTAPLARVIDFILRLDKGFGGAVGILIASAASIATIAVAIKGLIALKAGLAFVALQFKVLGNAINATGDFAGKTGPTIAKYGDTAKKTGFAAQSATMKFKAFGKAIGRMALIAGAITIVDKMISVFNAGSEATKEMNEQFGSISIDFAEKLKDINREANKTPDSLKKLSASLDETTKKTGEAGEVNKAWGLTLGSIALGAGLVALTVATGGAAVIAYGVAVAAGAASVTLLSKAHKELESSAGGRKYLEQQKKINDLLAQNRVELRKLGVQAGQIDFSAFKDAEKDINIVSQRLQAEVSTIKANIAANKELIKTEEAKTELDDKQQRISDAKVARAQENIKADQKQLVISERQAKAASDMNVLLIRQGDAATIAGASVEHLAEATEKLNQEIATDLIISQTESIKRYGKEANAASLIAAAGIAAEVVASEQRAKDAEKQLAGLEERRRVNGILAAEEEALQAKLTQTVAKETQTQAQLGIDARNAVIDAFEQGIQQANQKVDILAGAASKLKGAFDNVTGSFTSGLSAAVGLIDELVSREIKGLEVGSDKRKQLIRIQLKAQAVAEVAENNLAQMKLRVQNKIATSEARIAALRLQSEAKIAAAKGEVDIAKALQEAASVQGEVIRGLEAQFQIESTVLDLQKQQTNEKLISKGLEEQIGKSSGEVAAILGVQNTSLLDGSRKLMDMVKFSDKYAGKMGEAATSAQENTEEAAKLSLGKGLEQAQNVKDALDGAKGAAEGLKTVAETINTPFSHVEGTAKGIANYLEDSVREAAALARIIANGGDRRAMGGPVNAGQTYTVNDGGGREGFLNNAGTFKMLPAARNMKWTAPTSGTVIPAGLVDRYRSMYDTNSSNISMKDVKVDASRVNGLSASVDSGNLVQRIATAMSNSGGNQRITNHVTIQSQQPVTDASKIMTSVARAKLRRGGGI